jgi:hypothetical protein
LSFLFEIKNKIKGDTAGTGDNRVLRQAPVTVRDPFNCDPINHLSEKQICAGDMAPIHDTCQGDSGGPLILKNNNRFYLSGVVR